MHVTPPLSMRLIDTPRDRARFSCFAPASTSEVDADPVASNWHVQIYNCAWKSQKDDIDSTIGVAIRTFHEQVETDQTRTKPGSIAVVHLVFRTLKYGYCGP